MLIIFGTMPATASATDTSVQTAAAPALSENEDIKISVASTILTLGVEYALSRKLDEKYVLIDTLAIKTELCGAAEPLSDSKGKARRAVSATAAAVPTSGLGGLACVKLQGSSPSNTSTTPTPKQG